MISILDYYIARHLIKSLLLVFAVLFGIAEIFDMLEFLRRGSSRPDMNLGVAMQMTLLNSPYLIDQIMPFVILFGSLHAFLSLIRNSEMTAMRAASMSPWHIIKVPALIVGLIALFQVTVITHIATPMYQQVQQLEQKIFGTKQKSFSAIASGLWLREQNEDKKTIIHARISNPSGTELRNVVIIETTMDDKFLRRIDALRAVLGNEVWELHSAYVSSKQTGTVSHPTFAIPTSITPKQLKTDFTQVENISFWRLGGIIKTMENAGFQPTQHIVRYHTLLAKPLLLISMMLLAVAFTTRLHAREPARKAVALCIITGFVTFSLTNIIQTFGLVGTLPALSVGWIPAIVYTLIAAAMIIHKEEG